MIVIISFFTSWSLPHMHTNTHTQIQAIFRRFYVILWEKQTSCISKSRISCVTCAMKAVGGRHEWAGSGFFYPMLRFKRTGVEKGIPLNGLSNPWSTLDWLGTSFEIRNLLAWLHSGVLWFGLKWERQANKGKTLLGRSETLKSLIWTYIRSLWIPPRA